MGKRKVFVVILERGGNSVPAVCNTENQAAPFLRGRIAKARSSTPTKRRLGIPFMSV
jgi:hypothetical protein